MAEKLLPLSAMDHIKTYCANNDCSNYYQVLNAPLTLVYGGYAQVLIVKQSELDRECTIAFFHGDTQDTVLGTPKQGDELSIWTGSRGWQVIQTGSANTLSAKQISEILGGELET